MNKTEIIAKLKSAETGSHELSADAFKYFNEEYKDWTIGGSRVWRLDSPESYDYIVIPKLSETIDAATRLAEERGFLVNTQTSESGMKSATVHKNNFINAASEQHKKLPIAILLALIYAVEAEDE